MRSIAGAALLAVLLASFATAYAMWSETLRANITVYTGEVDVAFDSWSCSDTGADPQIPGSDFNNTEGKDVASCSVEQELTDDEGDVIKLNITLSNAYPGYYVEVDAVVKNVGTVPVKLYSSNINNTHSDEVSVELVTPDDTQIHKDETSTYTIKIWVNQEAEENSEYSIEVTLQFAQWNEVP